VATVKLDPAKGVQIPNLTTTERNAISSPETGALIWNTTTSAINQYNGSAWSAVDTSTDNTKLPLAGGTMTGGLVISRDEGHIRAQSATTTAKNISMFYNNASDHGQINCDQSGVNQKNLWITGLNLQFGRNTSTEYFKIADSGNVTVTAGDLTIAGSGKGVYLGGTGAANKLDDYEEGLGTPVVKYGTTTMSLHGGALARWVKIGSSVTYLFEFRISNTNSGSGGYTLALPFVMMDGGYAVGGIRIYNGAVAGGEFLGLHQNSSTLQFNRNRNNTSTTSITPTLNAYYYGSITYRTT
jgi:hypothetical protein